MLWEASVERHAIRDCDGQILKEVLLVENSAIRLVIQTKSIRLRKHRALLQVLGVVHSLLVRMLQKRLHQVLVHQQVVLHKIRRCETIDDSSFHHGILNDCIVFVHGHQAIAHPGVLLLNEQRVKYRVDRN